MKKNNKIILMLLSAALSGTVLTSCEDEVLVPVEDKTKVEALLNKIDSTNSAILKVDAANNTLMLKNEQLENILDELNTPVTTKIQYTVNVLSASNTVFSGNGRGAGVDGVPGISIRLEQAGKSITATSTESGIAIFNDLKPGYASVFVNGAASNHTDVEYKVWLGDAHNWEDTINAATQIVLFPTSGDKAATIKGTALINLRADDDTLGRKYDDYYSVASLSSKYLSTPGKTDDYLSGAATRGTIFEWYPDGEKIKYDVAANRTVYAYPSLPVSVINNSTDEGWISSISYKGAIVSTKTDANGAYELKVPAALTGMDVTVEFEEVITGHTRLTRNASYYGIGASVEADLSGTGFETPANYELGTANEQGSTIVEYTKVLDRNNADNIDATTFTSVKRRVLTEQFKYAPYFVGSTSDWDSNENFVKPGTISTQNIYLFPEVKQ